MSKSEHGDTAVVALKPVRGVGAQRHVNLLRSPLRDVEAQRGELSRLEGRPSLLGYSGGQSVRRVMNASVMRRATIARSGSRSRS
jgi:hypothetical protein